jgi:LmbE family N-acetylglucosaminyl deacetylase
MKRKAYKLLILIIVAALLLMLCGCAEPVVSPSGTTAVLPSPTPTPTPAVIPETETPSATPEPTPEPTEEIKPDAEDITKKVYVSVDGHYSDKLSDYSFYSKHKLNKGAKIEISSYEKMHSLYIIWDKIPGEWTLNIGDEKLTCGKNGFIHEYIELPCGCTRISIELTNDGATICDVYVFTYGNLPRWVQIWNPPYEDADMLLLPTHADDEHLYFGGMMPYYAGQLQYKVQIAYLTNHWGEPYRPHELLNGLWTVGMTAYPVISEFEDKYCSNLEHAKTIYPLEDVLNFQVELLRRFKPEVVIGHDLKGEYGHGAHMLNAYALTLAVEYAADSTKYISSYEKYGAWDTPKLYLHLYEENKILMNWDIPLERFNGLTAFEMAVQGYDCHKSQHIWSFAVRQGESQYDCRWFGLYRSLVGPDVEKNDVFENILSGK